MVKRKISDKKEKILKNMLSIIKKKPGIRPYELNKVLKLEHSWPLRLILIKRGLVKKKKDGITIRYYAA